MLHSQIGPIAVHFPERVETNEELQARNPEWDLALLAEKTGIYSRTIAAPNETASDLGVQAAERLFRENAIDPKSIDYVLLCTQPQTTPPDDSVFDPGPTRFANELRCARL